MTLLLLRAARRVWISIPGWEAFLRPYALGRPLAFEWLPIFSNISVADDPIRTQAIRRRYSDGGKILIGHFGTYGTLITSLLEPILLCLADDAPQPTILLIGGRSEQFRENLLRKEPRLANFVRATGQLPADEISHHLAACDLLIQPYPDGVSSRRTSFMAGLSHGKPIVTTAGHLTEPFWSQHSAVALAPAGDTRAFVEHVRRLSGDSGGRLRAGREAHQFYQEQFDLSRTIRALRRAGSAKERECAF
jgi:glycosyltransferase involved in cell wall biosynthesis